MTTRVIILGGGGHARMLADTLRQMSRAIHGYSSICDEGELIPGVPYLGNDEVILGQPTGEVGLVNGVGSIGDNWLRRRLFEDFRRKGFCFLEVVHAAAILSPQAALGQGCQLMPGAIVNAGSELAENVIINSRALVEHDCQVGGHTHIASGALLCGGCRVGESAHVGAGAVVIQSLSIGHGAVIGAGAVVTKDVEPMTLVTGVPARFVRHLNR